MFLHSLLNKAKSSWDFSYVDTTVTNGIATITINRPEAMNALNVTVVEQLTTAVEAANSDASVHYHCS